MKKEKNTYLVSSVAVLFALTTDAYTATYNITHSGISNHGDASISGSIAWYFTNYGSNHTYNLTDDTRYYIGSSITLPSGATLKDSNKAIIRAGSGMDNKTMLYMGNNSTLNSITIDGNRIALTCIDAQEKSNVNILNSWVINTKNNFTSGKHDPHLINLNRSENAYVSNCTLKNAGCNPIVNTGNWDSVGRGISGGRNSSLTVVDCLIEYTMGSSISIARGDNVWIEGNTLRHASQCRTFNNYEYGEDSIIGYHNYDDNLFDVVIENNTITDYLNHGIHVSGRNITIENNRIYNGRHNAIRVDDQRSPTECSTEITVKNNYVEVGYGPHTTNGIRVNHYEPATTTVSGNKDYNNTSAAANLSMGGAHCN